MPTLDQRKSDLVSRIAQEVATRVPSHEAASIGIFVNHYFAIVSPEDMLYASFETLVGGVLSLWEFGRDRKPGETRVRLFNPTSETHGWSLNHTVLEVVNDDMPFLVDSIQAELGQRDRTIHMLIHPVVGLARQPDGTRLGIPAPEDAAGNEDGVLLNESYMHIEIDQETSERDLEAVRDRLHHVLNQVRVAVNDWHPMRRRMREVIESLSHLSIPFPAEDLEEIKAFLEWLHEGYFVFLGYRHYDFVTRDERDYLQPAGESGLGILREIRSESVSRGGTPFTPEFSGFARRQDVLVVTKANSRSVVHRPALMDRISIKTYGADGNLTGEDRFLGLFTQPAYKRSVFEVPLVRRKALQTIERSGFGAASHDGKALVQILETLPRDEAFQISVDQMFEMSVGILQIQERRRIELFVRKDVFERYVSCIVFVPRDRWDTRLRDRTIALFEEAFAGQVFEVNAEVGDSPLARAHFIVRTTPGQIPEYDVRRLEAILAEAARTWSDRLRESLTVHHGEERGLDIHHRYKDAFPAAYQERFSAEAAIEDIELIEHVIATGRAAIELYHREAGETGQVGCMILHTGPQMALSGLMPTLENMGLRISSEVPYEVRPAGTSEHVRIRDFSLDTLGFDVDFARYNRPFQETFSRIAKGDVEDDGFNRLVLLGGMECQDVVVLRAYARFLKQTGIAAGDLTMQRTLANNTGIARALVQYFRTLFDPAMSEAERDSATAIRLGIDEALEDVSNPDEDRILRSFLNAIDSTLRTNFFQTQSDGTPKPYLSFKFDSKNLHDLPLPRPMFEIFVYSTRIEGVHLRGGKVARGGIRWSDRHEDFRTEILGLMKAQTVKNTVIVPVGAKGGFIVKHPPASGTREDIQAEGIACYKTLIRGLLDITDNLDGNTIVPPAAVIRRDGDDPYLVVAADKGTATFSDIANGIAGEYGFWLGDAFASGGSAGYDHKGMGITARGAWEAVKRHFLELGTDIQREDYTVVGVGDMSGDVFGNGMLLSRYTKLIGAFNHLHIFVDPDPDPEKSFAERERLFALPRSSWSDYNPALLSPGGAVFDRRAKSLTVSERVRDRFDLADTNVTPAELMNAILKARADLLWLGGIGTFVKSSEETHLAARDRANDAIRVNADELRVRVVGEGANLGLTQAARIEFALRKKGKINTDAIDNSAGVDTSDHEVNIKILVDEAVRRGRLAPGERLDLLREMTDEVAELVLRDNYQQTQAISIAFEQGESVLDAQLRFMRMLERQGRLDRSLEGLPDDETIAERHASHQGLMRPELAILLAYSKIWLYQECLGSTIVDDVMLEEDLARYFPTALQKRFPDLIREHRLRREIIATFIANNLVNRVGMTFISQIVEDTGAPVADVARAYLISRDAFDLRSLFDEMSHLDDRVSATTMNAKMIEVARVVDHTTRWILRIGASRTDVSARIGSLRTKISDLTDRIEQILPDDDVAALGARAIANVGSGFPEALARRLACLPVLASSLDIVQIAGDSRPLLDVARVYFAVGARFELQRLRNSASSLAADTPWQKAATASLVEDLFEYQNTLTRKVLEETGGTDAQVIARWIPGRQSLVDRTDQLIGELKLTPSVDLAMLTVLGRQLRGLAS